MIDQKFYGAATICHEAANQPEFGQIGVGHVILNRAILRNLTIKGVVYQKKQFSCYNSNKQPPIEDYEAFIIAQMAFQKAIDERLYGYNFFGADHYHATYMDPYPSWITDMEVVAQIGQHIFYKAGY